MITQDRREQKFKQYEYFHVPNYSGLLDIASDNGGAEYLASLANRPKGDPEVAGAKAEYASKTKKARKRTSTSLGKC